MRKRIALGLLLAGCLWLVTGVAAQMEEVTPEAQPAARLILFHSPTCPHCREVIEHVLPELQATYGEALEIELLDLSVREPYIIYASLHQQYPDLPAGVPQGFIGTTFLIGGDQFRDDLPALIDECLAAGGCAWPFDVRGALAQLAEESADPASADAAAPVELEEATVEGTQAELSARFASFSVPAVAAAGLLDGVNPCAFATIIFFVSYLTIAGRVRREVLLVGGAFTLAVFLTYLLLGLGLSAVIEQLGFASTVTRLIYLVTALICIALVVLSLWDYRKIRQGKLEEISLQLPKWLKLRIHRTIREGSRHPRYVPAAFAAGVMVSVFELACTGQVYLPTIVYMTSIEEARLPAFGYLVLYNLMFVVPLIAVFTVVYFGTSSQRLTGFFQRHAGAVKLLTAVLFAGLGLWLLALAVG